MKNRKKTYTDNPDMNNLVVAHDPQLPSPEFLSQEPKTKKVTIELTQYSLDKFRTYAKRNNAHYQTMIRRLVDEYARNVFR